MTTIRGNLARPNCELQVIRVQSEDEKMIWLAQNINSLNGTGLIYTGTRVDTEIYAKWLQFVGVKAIDYNAGLDAAAHDDAPLEEAVRRGVKIRFLTCHAEPDSLTVTTGND